MAGGFLMGLGQGLQRAAGSVGNYQEAQRRQDLVDENQRQFDLSHDLALRQQEADEAWKRTQANQWGVEDMYRQGAERRADKALGLQEDAARLAANQFDAAELAAARSYGLDRLRTLGLNRYYDAMSNAASNKYQNHFYGAQAIRPFLSSIDSSIASIMDKWKDPYGLLGNDPLKNQAMTQLDVLRRQKAALMGEYGKQLGMDPAALEALTQALTTETGGGVQADPNSLPGSSVQPEPNPLQTRPSGGLFRR